MTTDTTPRVPEKIDLLAWTAEHARELRPPVNNKQLWEAGQDFVVQVVGGPNRRTDFHVSPHEELFFQIRGNMRIDLMAEEGPCSVEVREGQMWLLPAGMPHSPQRPEAGSVGLVIERSRRPDSVESFRWYCRNCSRHLHETSAHVGDLENDLPRLLAAFVADVAARTCAACGTVHPGQD